MTASFSLGQHAPGAARAGRHSMEKVLTLTRHQYRMRPIHACPTAGLLRYTYHTSRACPSRPAAPRA